MLDPVEALGPACERDFHAGMLTSLVSAGPETVIDVLSQQAGLLLGVQNQLVEKQGLTIADNLREASQVNGLMCEQHFAILHSP